MALRSEAGDVKARPLLLVTHHYAKDGLPGPDLILKCAGNVGLFGLLLERQSDFPTHLCYGHAMPEEKSILFRASYMRSQIFLSNPICVSDKK